MFALCAQSRLYAPGRSNDGVARIGEDHNGEWDALFVGQAHRENMGAHLGSRALFRIPLAIA